MSQAPKPAKVGSNGGEGKGAMGLVVLAAMAAAGAYLLFSTPAVSRKAKSWP